MNHQFAQRLELDLGILIVRDSFAVPGFAGGADPYIGYGAFGLRLGTGWSYW
jgi:hypothetical protein